MEGARERLLLTGLELFAKNGYAKTSIRQIALAAGANVAAVSYYFGNKAGLYRAVYLGAPGPSCGDFALNAKTMPAPSLARLYGQILEPLRDGPRSRLWIQLQRREMLEPTGLWQEQLTQGIPAMHAALLTMLCARLGLDRPDDDVQALAVSVVGPAIHLLMNCEVIDVLAPQLLAGPDAIDRWGGRLVSAAEALIGAERRRRQRAARNAAKAAVATRPRRRTPTSSPTRGSRT